MGTVIYPYQGKRERIYCSHPWNMRVMKLCSLDLCCIFCIEINKCGGVCPTIKHSYAYRESKVIWRQCPHKCSRKEFIFRKVFEHRKDNDDEYTGACFG